MTFWVFWIYCSNKWTHRMKFYEIFAFEEIFSQLYLMEVNLVFRHSLWRLSKLSLKEPKSPIDSWCCAFKCTSVHSVWVWQKHFFVVHLQVHLKRHLTRQRNISINRSLLSFCSVDENMSVSSRIVIIDNIAYLYGMSRFLDGSIITCSVSAEGNVKKGKEHFCLLTFHQLVMISTVHFNKRSWWVGGPGQNAF